MGITSAERQRVLEILSSAAYSKTAREYDRSLDDLRNTKIKSVIDYVMANWHPIKEQWVTCYKDSVFNLIIIIIIIKKDNLYSVNSSVGFNNALQYFKC
jgi:hypothetical protein